MHSLDNLGITKITKDVYKKVLDKGLKIIPSKHEDFYFIFAEKGQKKIAASCGVKEILYISTDYFGGFGEQQAKLVSVTLDHKDRKKTIKFKDPLFTINKGLAHLGLEPKKDMDQFDILGIGKFRSNEDVLAEFKKQNSA